MMADKKPVVLVIEDEPAMRKGLVHNLEYEGFVVETCDDGHEALATVKRFMPDLLLLDLMLPHGADGFEMSTTAMPAFAVAA